MFFQPCPCRPVECVSMCKKALWEFEKKKQEKKYWPQITAFVFSKVYMYVYVRYITLLENKAQF